MSPWATNVPPLKAVTPKGRRPPGSTGGASAATSPVPGSGGDPFALQPYKATRARFGIRIWCLFRSAVGDFRGITGAWNPMLPSTVTPEPAQSRSDEARASLNLGPTPSEEVQMRAGLG